MAVDDALTCEVIARFNPHIRSETLGTKEYQYTVVYEPSEDGGFVVTVPALPGLVTEGDTLDEARAMAEDAIRGYLESLLKDQLPIPPDREAELIKEKVRVAIPAA